jgi:hypothetical protein
MVNLRWLDNERYYSEEVGLTVGKGMAGCLYHSTTPPLTTLLQANQTMHTAVGKQVGVG